PVDEAKLALVRIAHLALRAGLQRAGSLPSAPRPRGVPQELHTAAIAARRERACMWRAVEQRYGWGSPGVTPSGEAPLRAARSRTMAFSLASVPLPPRPSFFRVALATAVVGALAATAAVAQAHFLPDTLTLPGLRLDGAAVPAFATTKELRAWVEE